MKTKEELTKDLGFVRDLEDICATPSADEDVRKCRDTMFRKAQADLDGLIIPHVRRISHAVFALEFPSETAVALRKKIMYRLAKEHNLRDYRTAPAAAPAGGAK